MIPKVVQVLPGSDFTVYVYFLDGAIRALDVKPLLEKGGVFTPLRDEETFRNSLTVLLHGIWMATETPPPASTLIPVSCTIIALLSKTL